MKLKAVKEQIVKLRTIESILEKEILNEEHFIFKTYIETESLDQTRKFVTNANIRKQDGNKYQVNDISNFIANGSEIVDKETQDLAQTILKKNKTKR